MSDSMVAQWLKDHRLLSLAVPMAANVAAGVPHPTPPPHPPLMLFPNAHVAVCVAGVQPVAPIPEKFQPAPRALKGDTEVVGDTEKISQVAALHLFPLLYVLNM